MVELPYSPFWFEAPSRIRDANQVVEVVESPLRAISPRLGLDPETSTADSKGRRAIRSSSRPPHRIAIDDMRPLAMGQRPESESEVYRMGAGNSSAHTAL